MVLPPLKIGSCEFATPILLAPMAGYTDAAFRALCTRFHCALTFTEMVSAEGASRRQPKTLFFLETVPEEGPVGAHIYGHDPAVMAAAAVVAEETGRFCLIDINAGCPVPKIMKRGAGAGLLKKPEQLAAVIRAVKAAVKLPVTVKTRIGLKPDKINIFETAQLIEEAGASALFLHARPVSVRHKGPPDLEVLARVKAERKIPVIGNGGIASFQSLENMVRQTGVDGIMIGQAAVGNPWLFGALFAQLNGAAFTPPSLSERRAVMAEHLERLLRLSEKEVRCLKRPRRTAEHSTAIKFRAFMVKYLRGLEGWKEMTRHLATLDSVSRTLEVVDDVFAKNKEVSDGTRD